MRTTDQPTNQNTHARLHAHLQSDHLLWDAEKIQGCKCNEYWYFDGDWTTNASDPIGYDCSRLQCPFGDNPNRPKSNVTNSEELEMQEIVCSATGGTFRISFRGDWSQKLSYNIGASDFENELQQMKVRS